MTNVSELAFGIPEIVLLFGVLQTLLLTVVLLAAPGKTPTANRLLCAFLLALALVLLEFVLVRGGVTLAHPNLLGVSLPAYFAMAPLYFLYVRTLTGERFERADALHLLPVLIGVLIVARLFGVPSDEKVSLILQMTGEGFDDFPLLSVLLISLISFQTITYFYCAYDHLERYQAVAKEQSANTSLLAADWLRKLSITFCCFVVLFYLAAGELFFFYQYRDAVVSPGLFSYGIAGFVFFVSWQMFRHPELFAIYTPGTLPEARVGDRSQGQRKYEKTLLAADQLAEYRGRLLEHMRRKRPYLDGELRLSQLAEDLGIQPHHLSQVINVSIEKSFFDFINQHRIDHAQTLLRNADDRSNMLAVAMDSGFNSKASFNRVFKKLTGLTPSAFRKQELEKATGEYLTR